MANAPELAAGSMVSISGALFNEAYTSVTALLTTVGRSGANAEEAESIGRQNNCFILWYKDINLIFVYIRASFKSLTGREPCTEHRGKHDRKRLCKAGWFTGLWENCSESFIVKEVSESVVKHPPQSMLSQYREKIIVFICAFPW